MMEYIYNNNNKNNFVRNYSIIKIRAREIPKKNYHDKNIMKYSLLFNISIIISKWPI